MNSLYSRHSQKRQSGDAYRKATCIRRWRCCKNLEDAILWENYCSCLFRTDDFDVASLLYNGPLGFFLQQKGSLSMTNDQDKQENVDLSCASDASLKPSDLTTEGEIAGQAVQFLVYTAACVSAIDNQFFTKTYGQFPPKKTDMYSQHIGMHPW